MSIYKSPISGEIPFNNATNGFIADNIQDAIVEARDNAVSQEQFSHSGIDTNLIIPLKRQMLVYQEIELESGKELDILGELVLTE